jgi:hypothetical protein
MTAILIIEGTSVESVPARLIALYLRVLTVPPALRRM